MTWADSEDLPMRVLLTDGNERATLAVTRALGAAGVEVVVGAESVRSLAGSSRYCVKQFIYPSPYTEPDRYLQCLVDTARTCAIDALFPMSDLAMHIISPVKAQFEAGTSVPIPSADAFEFVSDKYRLMQFALEHGVPVPDTLFVPGGDVERVIGEIQAFPVVVKPGCSLVFEQGRWVKTSVRYAGSREELLRIYRDYAYLKRPSLIQRRIVGEGCGLFLLADNGKLLGLFGHRRLRERPPSGGVSVLRESILPSKQMVDSALTLLENIRWHGVAMVEFKQDVATKVPYLMEINGRFWGSLQLAIDAGINFPLLLLKLAMGKPEAVPSAGYRVGVRSRWLLGDLDHLLMRLFKDNEGLPLPPGIPSKWRTVLSFLNFIDKNTFCEVERLDDPGPSVYEVLRYAKLR